jgi:hypothetical protein
MADLAGNINLHDSIGSEVSVKHLEGAAPASNTLEEPVTTTIIRDVKKIGFKLKYVLMPRVREEKASGLRDWDLWGPLILCLLLSLTLSFASSGGSSEDTASLVFSIVFCLITVGSVIITINTLLLGGTISFF